MSAWDSTPHRNLLLPENLERVRQALGNEGVIFGWHYYYAGGGSGSMFAFSDYESYYQEIIKSKPGDHFTVYSPDTLADQAIARIGAPRSNQPILLDHRFADVKNALAAGQEIAFMWRSAVPETGRIEYDAGVLWDLPKGKSSNAWASAPADAASSCFSSPTRSTKMRMAFRFLP